MEKNSTPKNRQIRDLAVFQKLDTYALEGSIPVRYQELLKHFFEGYHTALQEIGESIDSYKELFFDYLDQIRFQCLEPFVFSPYHERVRKPFDYYQFGVDILKPLIDLEQSGVEGIEDLQEIQTSLSKGNNVIFLANHQTEADPQAISILLEKIAPSYAENLIFVAGERVITDPLAVPFSMGRNLLCIYSKRYIDIPPELKAQKQSHNKKTMQLMSELLSEGGKAIYVAPSGGRDRPNSQGAFEVAPFDPQSIEMFDLMAKRASHPTLFYPLTLKTHELLPPPETVQVELGEIRKAKRGKIRMAFSPRIDMDNFPGAQTNYQVVPNKAVLPLLNPTLLNRQIEKLILANGMRVYLVSDPTVEQSAAGLAVEAGSWKDPKEYPGLAHFLEHMLFMGNAAYPKEFEYMQFIFDHGGNVNAYTASDRTVYMFSVNNPAFAQALDRFSHFFIDPLFLPSCINRELHAVDQEHAKNIEHDGWRQFMILKETGNAEHPNRGFSTGNAQTLSGIPQEVLQKWYKTHYSADKMHLVMISPLPIDQMRELAVQDFSKVAAIQVDNAPITTLMTSSNQRGHVIYIKPVKDIKQLSLVWEIPAQCAMDIERKAAELTAYVLEQEGENSLTKALKEEHLAEQVQVGCDRFSKDTLLFSIDISLTEQGLSQINKAVGLVFQAIARLKKQGIPKYLFDEIQTISQ
ncbi:MAG: insulinase family protein, partial [Chlamydiales bacterium]|nr:insulinase family protein [Chlamydiales bacterium]